MIIDGNTIAATILLQVAKDVQTLRQPPRMTAVTCAPNFETKKYLEMKQRRAAKVGIILTVVELPADSTTKQVVERVEALAQAADGVVVQLPLPIQVHKETVLAAIPVNKDPDGFSYGEKRDRLLPPVVGAIDEISKAQNIDWKNKRVIILGQGTLVGIPAARYARKQGARVRVYEKDTLDIRSLKTADIIISGIGQPHFITTALVQPGVMIFDAGTSEDGGVLAGDAHPDVAAIASLMTPVPGGIGPITIAYLLRNLVTLTRQ